LQDKISIDENEIFKQIKKIRNIDIMKSNSKYVDYIVNYNNRKIALIIKSAKNIWIMKNQLNNLAHSIEEIKDFDECLVVYNKPPIKEYKNIILKGKIRVVSSNDIVNYFG
jgi:hypothetical protein